MAAEAGADPYPGITAGSAAELAKPTAGAAGVAGAPIAAVAVDGAAFGAGGPLVLTSTAGVAVTVGAAGAVPAACSVPALIACSRARTAEVTSLMEVIVLACCARTSFLLSRRRSEVCLE